jgi:hypothetical protein
MPTTQASHDATATKSQTILSPVASTGRKAEVRRQMAEGKKLIADAFGRY